MSMFGDKFFRVVIKLKLGHYGVPRSNMTGVLMKREKLDTNIHRGRKSCEHESAHLSVKESGLKVSKPYNTLISAFRPVRE